MRRLYYAVCYKRVNCCEAARTRKPEPALLREMGKAVRGIGRF